MSDEGKQAREDDLAARIRKGGRGAPARLGLASLRQLTESLTADGVPPRMAVVLLGRRAVVAFPGLSAQQIVVTKALGPVRAEDFDFMPGVEILGDVGPALPALRAVAATAARHAWWFLTGWLALWWLLLVLADYSFAARLAELALYGSFLAFVIVVVFGSPRVSPSVRDALVVTGIWQRLEARERGVTRLLGACVAVSLCGVLFSHATMTTLQARGYLEPVTSAPVRAVATNGLAAGSVLLLALALAALADLREQRRNLLEELQSAASIVASRGPHTG